MLYKLKNLQSRSASAENLSAEKGQGGKAGNGRKGNPCLCDFQSGEVKTLLCVDGPGMIRHIWMTVPPGELLFMRNLILRMYWDHQEHPSVEVPLGDFFGVSLGWQRPMQSALVSMQNGKGFNCYIPMPFAKHARITVENDSGRTVGLLFYQVDFTLGDFIDDNTGYFHAQFRRENPCPLHSDYTILSDVCGRGVYLGTVLGVRGLSGHTWWGEGEVKFYMDGDSDYPTICGTGAEDYVGFAWGLQEHLSPYQGCVAADTENELYSVYRFHCKDPIYFQSDLKVTIQQIGFGLKQEAQTFFKENFREFPAKGVDEDSGLCYYDRSDDYSSVAYWYQTLPTKPFPALLDREKRSAGLIQDTQTIQRDDI